MIAKISKPLALAVLWASLLTPLAASAQTAQPADSVGLWVAPQITRYFRSYTSYQFGDPYDHRLNPLSRLEFPLDSWWGGLNLGIKGPKLAFELKALASMPGQDDIGAMRDHDWEDSSRPEVRTIYSETKTRLKESFQLDGKASWSAREIMGLPAWIDLRPLVGGRWQRFTFVAHDGEQVEDVADPGEPDSGQVVRTPLTGDGIWFRQEYMHAYAGLELQIGLDRLGLAPGSQVFLQTDLAWVRGENKDRHLLRGDRVTTENTTGSAWRLAGGVKLPLGGWGLLNLQGDYMYIHTGGTHTWRDASFPESPLTWDTGVKVWSQQCSLSLSLEVPF